MDTLVADTVELRIELGWHLISPKLCGSAVDFHVVVIVDPPESFPSVGPRLLCLTYAVGFYVNLTAWNCGHTVFLLPDSIGQLLAL